MLQLIWKHIGDVLAKMMEVLKRSVKPTFIPCFAIQIPIQYLSNLLAANIGLSDITNS